jgi:hypothetical protein
MNLSKGEVSYACQVCFLSDFQNLNHIMFCDVCDIGVHMRCYGIESIEDDEEGFICDICVQMKKRKSFHEMQCFICKLKGEGLMKLNRATCYQYNSKKVHQEED